MNTTQNVAYGSPGATHGLCNLQLLPAEAAKAPYCSHLFNSEFSTTPPSVDFGRNSLKVEWIDTRRLMAQMIYLKPVRDGSVDLGVHQHMCSNPFILTPDAHIASGMVGLPPADPARGFVSPVLRTKVPDSDDDFLASHVVAMNEALPDFFSAAALAPSHHSHPTVSVGQ